MKKQMYPKLLSLAIVSAMFVFLAFQKSEVPVSQANKNPDKKLKTVSFRMINDSNSESVFRGWNINAFLKIPQSSNYGAGC